MPGKRTWRDLAIDREFAVRCDFAVRREITGRNALLLADSAPCRTGHGMPCPYEEKSNARRRAIPGAFLRFWPPLFSILIRGIISMRLLLLCRF
jgi:hypothetical protein